MVAYRGTGPALNDLVSGQIDFMCDQFVNVIPQVKADTIKAYAIASGALAALPDVPTTKELGVDFIFSAWNAMVAPKGMPKDIQDKLVDALEQGHGRPGAHQALRGPRLDRPARARIAALPASKSWSKRKLRGITPVLKAAAAK